MPSRSIDCSRADAAQKDAGEEKQTLAYFHSAINQLAEPSHINAVGWPAKMGATGTKFPLAMVMGGILELDYQPSTANALN
jgi:hypothetical protein